MRKIIVLLVLICPVMAFADAFVPDFSAMKNLRCDFEEKVFDSSNNQISDNKIYRIFKLDDAYLKIYNNKEPIDNVIYYGNDKIEFRLQTMDNDSITMTYATINRINGTYSAASETTYDNEMFGVQHSQSSGVCKYIN